MKCQICHEKPIQHIHHIVSKCYGGTNKKYNKAHICAACHHEIHTGTLIVEGWFLVAPFGYQLIWHKKEQPSITGMESNKVFTY